VFTFNSGIIASGSAWLYFTGIMMAYGGLV